jgi:hypothetical protein
MLDLFGGFPLRFVRVSEAARLLGLSDRALERHRTYGTSPTCRKFGGRVVYGLDDFKAWVNREGGTSTDAFPRGKEMLR